VTVAIGVVHDELIHARFMLCLLALKTQRPGAPTIMVPGGPGNFDVARNKVASFFLENTKCSHLLTVDTDMVFTPDMLKSLLKRDVGAVSGAYFVNDTRPRPCFGRRDETGVIRTVTDWEEGELFEVDAVGGGFMLIHRDVLTAIGPPDSDRGGPWYRQSAYGASGSMLEPDHAFCQRVQQAGHKVYVDAGVFVGHIKPRVLGWE